MTPRRLTLELKRAEDVFRARATLVGDIVALAVGANLSKKGQDGFREFKKELMDGE